MLDIKTIKPNKHTQLVQAEDRVGPLAEVFYYDSEKCRVIQSYADRGAAGTVCFLLKSPGGYYFFQIDEYNFEGNIFKEIKTRHLHHFAKETAVSYFTRYHSESNRVTFEEAFDVSPRDI